MLIAQDQEKWIVNRIFSRVKEAFILFKDSSVNYLRGCEKKTHYHMCYMFSSVCDLCSLCN